MVEALEVLRICEDLRPAQRAILVSVGKLLSVDDDDSLMDTLLAWTQLSQKQRQGAARLLTVMALESLDADDIPKE